MSELTQARLKELLHYDLETGVFINLVRRAKNTKIGEAAGTLNDQGYIIISLDNRCFRAHRLAWFYVTGSWPTKGIDHKNGVRHDNRISNLREADQSQNLQNCLGHNKGITFCTKSSVRRVPWEVRLMLNYKVVFRRRFSTLEEAKAARRAAELEYHPFSKARAVVEDLIETV